jgi:type III secretion system FlhB-like substrate exporter
MLGSIALGAAVLALRPFVNVLGSIEKITKNLQMKHIKLVNKSMLELALGIAAMSTLYIPVIIGSATVLAIGVGLRPFVKTLGLISEATSKLEMKHIKLVNKSMLELALGIAAMSVLFLPVTFGSATVLAMGIALRPFVKTLKTISELGSVPTKLVRQVVNSLKIVGNFFKNNPIDSDAVKNAKKYRKMMRPFINTVSQLVKLKEMGSVPIKLVQQTLKAMRTIANYYVENPIKRKVIKQARRYKRMMRPFGHMIEHLSKLKNMGSIPIKLVQQTLKAMRTIANYYVENPIERKVIKQARRYKRMMRPFGHMVDHLSKLKTMGSIPIKLVQQTLRAMRTIANYYMENPIERKVIKQSRRYKRMLKPFGTTIEKLSKLKQMGSIPMKLVQQTLNAMSAIADFYQNLDMNSSKGTLNASILSAIMTSFGKTTESMKGIKGLKSVPTEAVESITASASNIIMFYNTAYFEDIDSIDEKSRLTELVVNKFINVAMNIQDNFANIKRIDFNSLYYIVSACRSIINYYRFTEFDATTSTKVPLMNNAIKSFSENIEYLKVIDLKTNNVASIDIALKSMKRILKFLKIHSLTPVQNKKAKRSISILKDVASTMSSLSNINSSNMTSIGSAISNALSGVNAVDMDQVEAVTNMFNAFNKISKSENVINKFTESVKEFTETCKDLMNAMGNNTDAINNIDMSGNRNSGSIFSNIKDNVYDFVSGESDSNASQTNGIRITNVDEVARAIAEKINGALSVDVPDAQIQLLINGTGGNEWTISRY